jgi:hypothetical protein
MLQLAILLFFFRNTIFFRKKSFYKKSQLYLMFLPMGTRHFATEFFWIRKSDKKFFDQAKKAFSK